MHIYGSNFKLQAKGCKYIDPKYVPIELLCTDQFKIHIAFINFIIYGIITTTTILSITTIYIIILLFVYQFK